MEQLSPTEYSPAFQELAATLDRTNDPGERRGALLRFYGLSAQAQAEAFLRDRIAAGTLKPNDDLGAMAQAAVDQMLHLIFRHNDGFGLDYPQFESATRSIVVTAFYGRLNEQLALAIAPPVGSA